MITRYITQITAHFNPLSASRTHKIPRLIIARLPGSPAPGAAPVKVSTKILPAASTAAGKVVVAFKDGRQLVFDGGAAAADAPANPQGGDVWDLSALKVDDVVDECDRHSRVLRRKEEIAG